MKRGLVSVALGVAGITLAARILGFGRSLVFSKTVGDTCLGDVYNAANTLPNVLFEIVAGGILAGVVVPVVARHAGAGRRDADAQTVSALITWTLLVLTPAGLAALAAAQWYGRAFAKADCAGSAEVVAALLVMFVPQIWFYGIAVVSAGVLQAHHRFAAAALAPLLSSVVVITAYLIFASLADPEDSGQLEGADQPGARSAGLGHDRRGAGAGPDHRDPTGPAETADAAAAQVRGRRSCGDHPDRRGRPGRAGAAAARPAADQLPQPAQR